MSQKTKVDKDPHVLVGFGKHDLKDLMAKIDDPAEEEKLLWAIDKHHWPPRYRRASICTEEDVEAFSEYMAWLKLKLGDF